MWLASAMDPSRLDIIAMTLRRLAATFAASVHGVVAEEVVNRGVRRIGARFRRERHDAARCLSILRLEAVRIHRELRQRLPIRQLFHLRRQVRKLLTVVPRSDLVKHFAETVDVGLRRAGAFGRDVAFRAHERERGFDVRDQPDVRELGDAVHENDVGRLDVAVNQPVPVQVIESSKAEPFQLVRVIIAPLLGPLGFLPYPYSDFIFSTIAEEWGFLGVARVLSQEPRAHPGTREPLMKLNPNIACRDKWKRVEALLRRAGKKAADEELMINAVNLTILAFGAFLPALKDHASVIALIVVAVIGIVQLLQGQILLGIILLIVAAAVGLWTRRKAS